MAEISAEDQQYFWRLSDFAESDTPLPTGTGFIQHRGDESAEFGHQLLLAALGSEQAIQEAIPPTRRREVN